jgi:hypothetical protein
MIFGHAFFRCAPLSFAPHPSCLGLAVLALLAATASARAQADIETPSNLQIVGNIVAGESEVAPTTNDEVLAVVAAGGRTIGSGSVLDGEGNFFVELSQSQSFNGTEIALRLRSSGGTFQLLFGASDTLTYAGGFPFPQRTTLSDVEVGPRIGGGGGDGGGGDDALARGDARFQGIDPSRDVTGDDVVDQQDVDWVVRELRRSTPDRRADINGDGLVSTLDPIVLIREIYSTQRRGSVVRVSEPGAPPADDDGGNDGDDAGDGDDGDDGDAGGSG